MKSQYEVCAAMTSVLLCSWAFYCDLDKDPWYRFEVEVVVVVVVPGLVQVLLHVLMFSKLSRTSKALRFFHKVGS